MRLQLSHTYFVVSLRSRLRTTEKRSQTSNENKETQTREKQ